MATVYNVTASATVRYKRATREHVILFFVFRDCLFEVRSNVMACDKCFRKCVDPCLRFLTPDDTHDLCIMCVGEEHACSVLVGAVSAHCECFLLRKVHSHLSLFSREEGAGICNPRLGSLSRGRRLKSWGSQMELTEEFERGVNLLHASAVDERELLEGDVLSLTSSDPAASALLVSSQKEQEVADEGKKMLK